VRQKQWQNVEDYLRGTELSGDVDRDDDDEQRPGPRGAQQSHLRTISRGGPTETKLHSEDHTSKCARVLPQTGPRESVRLFGRAAAREV